jgi:hypothetical protein
MCLLCGALACILSPSRYGEKQRRSDSTELSGIQLLSATAYQLKKPNQQLLIPITVWIGMEQAFIGADFTQVGTITGTSEHPYVQSHKLYFTVTPFPLCMKTCESARSSSRFHLIPASSYILAPVTVCLLDQKINTNQPISRLT